MLQHEDGGSGRLKRLHYQPIRGKAVEIIDDIRSAEEVASPGEEDYGIIRLAIEEVVVNIVKHAYPEVADGYIDVEIERHDESISLCFRDGGIPFNPLEHKAPDTSLPMDLRPMGGLGILLLRRDVDAINYEYSNNENILTVSLQINKQ
jgi:anti-sigma regulatory factor (Ser/Thr protein kinase)